MKKNIIVFLIVILTLTTTPIYKVKAEYIPGRGTFNYADLELSESLLTDLNNIVEFCESKKDEYEFLVYVDKDSNNIFTVKVWYTEIGGNPYYSMQPGNSSFRFRIVYKAYSNKSRYRFNSNSSITENFYDNFVTYFNENHGGIGTGVSSGNSVFSSDSFPYVFYYSTLENYYNSPSYDLVLDGTNYGKTSSNQFYTYYEWVSLYKDDFNKVYKTSEYSKIEVTFDLTKLNFFNECDNGECHSYIDFDLEYHENIITGLVDDLISNPVHEVYFTRYRCESELNCIDNLETESRIFIPGGNDSKNKYFFTYGNNSLRSGDLINGSEILKRYKVTFYLDANLANEIQIIFNTNVPFNVVEYEKSEKELSTVDLTNKYGALFVAKSHDSNISSSFGINGYFLIDIRDTYNTSKYNIEKYYTYGYCDYLLESKENYNCVMSNKFTVDFSYNSPYKVISFTNINYDNNKNAIVKYDSELFDVYILNNKTDSVTITDPVNGDKYIYNNNDYETNNKNEITIDYIKKILDEYWKKNESSKSVAKNIFVIIFDELPKDLYEVGVIVIFTIFICTVLFIVGWK